MIRLAAVAGAAVVLAFPAATATSAAPSPFARMKTVEGTLRLQTQLFLQRRWALLWHTYSPRFRRKCVYAAFVAVNRRERALVRTVDVRRVRARVRGNRAFVSYEVLLNGIALDVVTPADPDVYVRVRGRWYDELDPKTPCPTQGATA